MPDLQTSRRQLLRGVTAGSAGLLFSGSGAAKGSPPARIVGTASPSAEREAKRRAESVKRVLDFGDIGKAVAGKFSDKAAERLRRREDVRYVEEDSTYHAISQTLPWGIDRVDADLAHDDDGFTGSGADIAIIDTGIDDDHPDLQVNVGRGKAYVNCGSVNACRFGRKPNDNTCNYEWSDDNDHGTHCAGIADAADNNKDVVGVSTEATLHAVKVLDGCGSGYLSDVAAGIEYVAHPDQGWDVASMSLGASSGDQTLKDACQYAYDNGVLLVAAAGNDGPCSDCVGYPAAYSTVIAVSSTASDDSLSDFSSTGPEVELAAPGTDILSTVPPESSSEGTDTFSGTSMACPHVSGAGGILMAKGQSNKEAQSNLQETAEDIGLGEKQQGYGLLDAEAAVGSLTTDPSPTVDSLSASEVETSNGDAEFDVSWSVSDDEDDLSSVDLTLTDSNDIQEDTASKTVSGSSASGTTHLVAADDEGSGNTYTVDLTVTDSNNNTSSSSTTVTETEDAPSVDSLSAGEVETSNGDAEFDVEWSVSDNDGDLSSLDLTLHDDTAGSNEETVNVSLTGSSDSGTTHLVASGDEGKGHNYTVTATVTDTDGTSSSSSTTVTETEDAPTVDSLSASEVETSDGDAEFDVSWSVSDDDGDLSSLDLTLHDDSAGSTEETVTVSVTGSSDSGTTHLVASGDEGKGHNYTVTATVTDTDGTSSSDSTSVSETESTSSAPTIDTHAISEAGSPNPHLEITVDWGVSDNDGDLSTVRVMAEDSDGRSFGDTHTHSVSGSSASGTDQFQFKHANGETADVTIYVEDGASNSASHTEQVTE